MNEEFLPDGATPALVNGSKCQISRTAAFSAEGPSANAVTCLPVLPVALRVPLCHGTYTVTAKAVPNNPDLTQINVVQGGLGDEVTVIAQVVIETRSPAPEIVFRDYVTWADPERPGSAYVAGGAPS